MHKYTPTIGFDADGSPIFGADDGLIDPYADGAAAHNAKYLARLIVHFTAGDCYYGGGYDYDGIMGAIWAEICQLTNQRGTPVSNLRVLPPADERPKSGRKPVTRNVALKIFARDEYKCVRCGSPEELQVDHIHPVSKGGTNDPSNLQTLCRPCNIRKGAKLPEDLGDDW